MNNNGTSEERALASKLVMNIKNLGNEIYPGLGDGQGQIPTKPPTADDWGRIFKSYMAVIDTLKALLKANKETNQRLDKELIKNLPLYPFSRN